MRRKAMLLSVMVAALVLLVSGVALAASQTTDGNTLTNTVKSSTLKRPVVVTLTEDSRSAIAGPTNQVSDRFLGGPFKVKSITAPDFDCTGIGSNQVTCSRKAGNDNPLATIKIVAKAFQPGRFQNEATDSYSNDTLQSFRVKRR
jgi:hypothetical protein